MPPSDTVADNNGEDDDGDTAAASRGQAVPRGLIGTQSHDNGFRISVTNICEQTSLSPGDWVTYQVDYVGPDGDRPVVRVIPVAPPDQPISPTVQQTEWKVSESTYPRLALPERVYDEYALDLGITPDSYDTSDPYVFKPEYPPGDTDLVATLVPLGFYSELFATRDDAPIPAPSKGYTSADYRNHPANLGPTVPDVAVAPFTGVFEPFRPDDSDEETATPTDVQNSLLRLSRDVTPEFVSRMGYGIQEPELVDHNGYRYAVHYVQPGTVYWLGQEGYLYDPARAAAVARYHHEVGLKLIEQVRGQQLPESHILRSGDAHTLVLPAGESPRAATDEQSESISTPQRVRQPTVRSGDITEVADPDDVPESELTAALESVATNVTTSDIPTDALVTEPPFQPTRVNYTPPGDIERDYDSVILLFVQGGTIAEIADAAGVPASTHDAVTAAFIAETVDLLNDPRAVETTTPPVNAGQTLRFARHDLEALVVPGNADDAGVIKE